MWCIPWQEIRLNWQQRFYFGIWTLVEDRHSQEVQWRVLEIDFAKKRLRCLNEGTHCPVYSVGFCCGQNVQVYCLYVQVFKF
jgi:hypothetical protein